MSTLPDPRPALAEAFAALGRGPLPEGLVGEAGTRLLEWLSEDGVTTAVLADAQASYADYAAGAPQATPAEARSDMTTIAYRRGYPEMPRLMGFLLDAIARLESPAQAAGLADYLGWLARRMALSIDA
jgi:hypothetical protein